MSTEKRGRGRPSATQPGDKPKKKTKQEVPRTGTIQNRGKRLSAFERDYIQKHCLTKTDLEIADFLGRDLRTISSYRARQLKVIKRQGGVVESMQIGKQTIGGQESGASLDALSDATENERNNFFVTQLKNSMFYDNLKKEFTSEEIEFYVEEWGILCVQFEDVVATEKRQIDKLIKAEIMEHRLLRNIKETEQEIELLIKEVNDLRKNKNVADDEIAQEYDNSRITLIRQFSGQSQAMANDYQKCVMSQNKIMAELNARRKDRVDTIRSGQSNFLGLVKMFQERKIRDNKGKHLELVKMAKDHRLTEWRSKQHRFRDGTIDCVLMDEGSTVKEKEVVRISDRGHKITRQLVEDQTDQNIIVVSNSVEDVNIFNRVLTKHTVTYVDSAEKLISKIKSEAENINYIFYCIDDALLIDWLLETSEDQHFAIIFSRTFDGVTNINVNIQYEVCPMNEFVIEFGNLQGNQDAKAD